ncbi:ABC transporter ATP-binding protein [Catellatospora bangladeshensis]|uniref:ABC transporter n=1 Tax=Catellatospora bangladeshensis TaxID=310355 RepID=A0A8J3NHI1_9ACTN|nr:ABC transporter ATP-binding protein [Catellatospora bangladeshensis]GIF79301.1 ABC transporter [Catellatospora bangladeshensis]
MRSLPVADPGTPDTRSAARYLWWLASHQSRTIGFGMFFGITWMLTAALMPMVIGKAIDAGITTRDTTALAQWAGAFLLLGLVQAGSGIMRHRNAVFNWMSANFRTVQAVVRHANRLGATLPKRLATGEVVAIGAADTSHIGNALDISARGSAAVVSLITVTVILLTASVKLGLVVLLGVPVQMAVVSLLIKPLHRRQQAYRDQQGTLTGRAVDIVAGLRVLRGIGGEQVFADRYREQSQELRAAGIRAARIDSLLEAIQVLMPGLFLALVTWLGARLAVTGEIQPGELASFYGYAAFLIMPLRTLAELLEKLTRGHVSAGRVLQVLRLEPEITGPAAPRELPAHGVLADAKSGLTLRPGVLTVLAADRPEDAIEIADRLGRYAEGEVTLGGVPLAEATRDEVRARILVADNNARLFSGPLREELDPAGHGDEARLTAALHAASAEEIVDALPGGLDAFVAERGREFSGGQQQRLRLARALVADPPILILVEPTSAVDAHTEARIAGRLGEARQGRTTLVAATSPLLLDRADHVVYVEDGKVAAEGTHRELLAAEPGYRAVVTRSVE